MHASWKACIALHQLGYRTAGKTNGCSGPCVGLCCTPQGFQFSILVKLTRGPGFAGPTLGMHLQYTDSEGLWDSLPWVTVTYDLGRPVIGNFGVHDTFAVTVHHTFTQFTTCGPGDLYAPLTADNIRPLLVDGVLKVCAKIHKLDSVAVKAA